VLDSADASEKVDGVCVSVSVSVVFAASTGVVVASAVVVASVGVVCSVVVVWVGSASAVCVVEDDAASGDCAGAFRAFVEPVDVAPRFTPRSRAREDLPFVPAPRVAALALLPGNACAASKVKTPVSVAEPASSQRLQRFSLLRAASLDLLVGEVFTTTYSPSQPSIH
jgi:hypothetical protein